MSWVHETGYGPALDHEGGVADVLEAGTDPSTPPDQLDPRVTGWRAACQCGWRGTQFYLRSEWPDTEYALAPAQVEQHCRAEWERHLQVALPVLAIHDLTQQIAQAQDDLADAVRAAMAAKGGANGAVAWTAPVTVAELRKVGRSSSGRPVALLPLGWAGVRSGARDGRSAHEGSRPVREVYQAELRSLIDRVAVLARLVETALGRAGSALLDADLGHARVVVEVLEPLGRLHAEIDDSAVDLIARQQPVAGDLRTIVAVLRMNADLERMGVLTRHLAEMVRARHPHGVVPSGLREQVQRMSQVAGRLMAEACAVIEVGDVDAAMGMAAEDDEMDRLRGEVYERVLAAADGFEPGQAMDAALIARYYERLADHAVSVGRCMAFRAGRVGLDPTPHSVGPGQES